MTQPPYLIRFAFGSGSRHLQQAETLRVTHPKVMEFKDKGGYREAIDTGRVLTKELEIRGGAHHDVTRLARTAAAVKSVVRRLRPEEAAVLDEIDTEIAAVTARLKELRSQRAAAVQAAWTKAHVVRLAEVEALIPTEDT